MKAILFNDRMSLAETKCLRPYDTEPPFCSVLSQHEHVLPPGIVLAFKGLKADKLDFYLMCAMSLVSRLLLGEADIRRRDI